MCVPQQRRLQEVRQLRPRSKLVKSRCMQRKCEYELLHKRWVIHVAHTFATKKQRSRAVEA